MTPDWEKLKQDVDGKIDALEVIHNGLKSGVSKKLIERDLIGPALAHLARFCACVEVRSETHFCSGANIDPVKREDLTDDENRFKEQEESQ